MTADVDRIWTGATRELATARSRIDRLAEIVGVEIPESPVRARMLVLIEGLGAGIDAASRAHRAAYARYIESLSAPEYVDSDTPTRPIGRQPKERE